VVDVRSGDIKLARAASNPNLSPHLSFVDMGGHGYAVVSASDTSFEVDFVCIPRPLERSVFADGGPVLYRVRHRSALWSQGELPKLEQTILSGDPRFSY
jgi:alkaline phosphatase D